MTAQTILPANSVVDSGFDVANSARFEGGTSDSLRWNSGANGNMILWTVSMWIKRGKFGTEQTVWKWGSNASAEGGIYFDANDQLVFINDSQNGGSNEVDGVFRDPSAWYHVVWACDTAQSSNANRWKVYINGVQRTLTGGPSISQANGQINQGATHQNWIGDSPRSLQSGTSSSFFSGYIAEVVFIDGAALAPTSFGEFDEDSGIWKPIESVADLTFGTYGYYLNFQNAAELGTDVSGESNTFSETGLTAIDQSTDTCTNNFATLNPLNVPTSNRPTFAEGNLKVTSGTTGQAYMGSATIGVSSGKWYAEMKCLVIDSMIAGISANVAEDARDSNYPGQQGASVGILPDSGNKYISDSGSTHGDAFSANDILMIALDLDDNDVYFGRNGNWFDGSGNADENNPNSAISITAAASTIDGFYFFSVGDGGGDEAAAAHWNFGSPSYAISSGNADGEGFGNFEYAVPSGYLALCTKNLAENG